MYQVGALGVKEGIFNRLILDGYIKASWGIAPMENDPMENKKFVIQRGDDCRNGVLKWVSWRKSRA